MVRGKGIYSLSIIKRWFSVFLLWWVCFALKQPTVLQNLNIISKYLTCCNPLVRIDNKHFWDKICSRLRWKGLSPWIVCISNLSVKFFICRSFVRKNSCQRNKEKDSEGPYVGRFAFILFSLDNLRSHVARGATEDFNFFGRLNTSTKTKINQFRIELFI